MKTSQLMVDRRFWPLFWTQFLGAFNDNVFKNALVILIAFKAWTLSGMDAAQMVPLCAGLFIAPFFLFSALAGQLADKYPKHRMVAGTKAAEVVIMGAAALGFWMESLPMLVGVLFLMGTQSAFFGPIKYGVLPELLEEKELVGGNALIEMGTFLSILTGTILAGLLITLDHGVTWVSATVIGVAVLGLGASLFMPKGDAVAPQLRVRLNPITTNWETYQFTRKNRPVFLSILGVSWFWFFAASFMTLFPTYCKEVLHGNEHLITFLLTLFSVGIAGGSMLCDRFSRGTLELGLVPLGSIGMTVFAFDLFLAGNPYAGGTVPASLLSVGSFLQVDGSWRIVGDLFLLSFFSGFYIVPLQTLVQERTEASHRSRVVAGNNMLSSLAMVLSSVMLGVLGAFDVSIPTTFLVLTVLNAAVAVYIYTLIPEFMYRFLCWVVANVMYRVKVEGAEQIPADGGALMVANHVSYIDWMIIAGACRRPVRLVMHYSFMRYPLFRDLCKRNGVIPIASAKESPEVLAAALEQIDQELRAGNVVCLFPEGRLSVDGSMQDFKPGVERIVARKPVPVIPVALGGLWGSIFSKQPGYLLGRAFRRFKSRIHVRVGEPIAPDAVSASLLQERVAALREAA